MKGQAKGATRRVLTIDQALRWAYRLELPKSARRSEEAPLQSSWGAITRYGETMAEIDVSPNIYGVIPDFTATEAPHPDALAVAAAVAAVGELVLELRADWDPFRDLGDMGELGEAARHQAIAAVSAPAPEEGEAVRNLTFRLDELLRRFAVISTPPDWTAERPMLRYESHGNGVAKWFRKLPWRDPETGHWQEHEVDGFDAKARRPHPGAYRKSFLDPDPVPAGIWRAEWQAWVTALELLELQLAGTLETIDLRPCGLSLVPWEEERPLGRVLPAIAPAQRPMTLARGHWTALETLALGRQEPALMAERLAAARGKKIGGSAGAILAGYAQARPAQKKRA